MTSMTNLIEEALCQNPDVIFTSKDIASYMTYCGAVTDPQTVRNKLALLRQRGTVMRIKHGHYQAAEPKQEPQPYIQPVQDIQWFRDALKNAILMDDQEEVVRLRQKVRDMGG